ncbi:WD repeat-containing protein 62 isoform X2 [Paramormyrops kingsleyae]|uniref:WD repeat domain 62 n=1 Tax=Paramormyrops kingsleyae TaxID=1676925 RepID=A0A3B3SP17_9TELE|nr:mitogen-activated protein kinase-binding protein 1-like isoform X3 [Paramormyrops kingsleyae]
MAEAPFFGGGLNAVSFSSRVKKVTSLRKKGRQNQPRRNIHNRVFLEKVLGITTSSSSGLACDPNSGLVAYPAGCVVVILHPRKNKQSHILNTSRKTFTALAFSQDGKYLVTGESGHMPCVRVWDVADRTQVAEEQCHKYGVACVAFSTSGSYIVSVGYQHDMTVSVWEWKKGTVIASNKVSSRVVSVSFSEDNSYFVTAGNRHVKFWYLDASKERRVNSTVPLIGRSGLLGEQRNSMFCGLACGWGDMAGYTYCITNTGLLCQFNSRRLLDAWVDLKTSSARCLYVSEHYVFCGCADGTVRVFKPQNLQYITTLPRPHCLGVDITKGVHSGHLFSSSPDAEYPDTLALTFDPVTSYLTCVYNDHSVYVWDVRDVRNVGKVYSALYHSGCVWSVETYPCVVEQSPSWLSPGSFLTCSSDTTIRLWHVDPQQNIGPDSNYGRNLYSNDLMKIVYLGKDMQHLQQECERGEGAGSEAKSGIRVLRISPDGQHMAAGDRHGNLRIFGLQSLDELLKIEAHDSEVLCLEFSPTETGLRLLASASRDRLIHVFNMEKGYSLEQTVYDHSASITAIKFTGEASDVHMVSCGADKSIYFRTAEKSTEGLTFSRSHHVVEKATLYDMDLDATHSHAAIACQDRNIRVYDVKSGKLKKCFKGSLSDDGTLLKVQMDPSGLFLATSCSDKNICIFDYETGECVAALFGHSEIVTELKFTPDCRHLITVSGDSCVFVWRLDTSMTHAMRNKLAELRLQAGLRGPAFTKCPPIRKETYISIPRIMLPEMGEEEQVVEEEEEEEDGKSEEEHEDPPKTPAREDSLQDALDPMFLQTNGKLPMWARRLGAAGSSGTDPVGAAEVGPYQPRGRWAEQSDPQAIRSVLESRSLQLPLSPSPRQPEKDVEKEPEEDSCFHPQSLDSLLEQEDEEEESEVEEGELPDSELLPDHQRPTFLPLSGSEELFAPGLGSPEAQDYILYPANSTTLSAGGEGEFDVREQCEAMPERRRGAWGGEELSPDSACCVGSAESQASSQDPPQDDTDSLSQVSSTGSSGVEEEDEDPGVLLRHHFDTLADSLAANEKFDTDLRKLQPPTESIFLNPRLSISTRFLSRFQGRANKLGICLPLRPAGLPALSVPVITEEPSGKLTGAPEVTSKLFSDEAVSESVTPQEEGGEVVKVVKSRSLVRSSSVLARRNQRPVQGRKTIATYQWQGILGDVSNRIQLEESTPQISVQSSAEASLQKQALSGPSKFCAPTRPAVRPGRQSYMCTTASSRAKMSSENLNVTPTDEQPSKTPPGLKGSFPQDLNVHQECKENRPHPLTNRPTGPTAKPPSTSGSQPPLPPGNHSARAALHLDLAGPERTTGLKLRRRSADVTRLLTLTTPTEMMSLGAEGKSYISNIEHSLVSQGISRGRSLSALGSSMMPESGTAPVDQVPAVPPVRGTEGKHPPSVSQELPCRPGSPGPLRDKMASFPSPSEDVIIDPVSIQTCKEIVSDLQQSMKRALSLYSKLCSVEDGTEQQLHMRSILTDAFAAVQSELDSVQGQRPPPKAICPSAEESPGRQLKDDRTVALLEKYSEMLLRIAEKKMDCN